MSFTHPKFGLVTPDNETKAKDLGAELKQMGATIESVLEAFDYNGADPNAVIARVAAIELHLAKLGTFEATVPFEAPYRAYNASQGTGVLVTRVGNQVTVQGAAAIDGTDGMILENPLALLPEWAFPKHIVGLNIQQGSAEQVWNLSVTVDGKLCADRYRPASAASNRWLPFSGTYSVF